MNTNPILIYLAGPQDDVTSDEARGWRENMVEVAPSGVAFFSPAHAYVGVSPANFAAVENANRHMVRACDGLIANLSGPGRAFGTIREIEFASLLGTPVAVIGTLDSLMVTDLGVVDTAEAAVLHILEAVHAGRQPPAFLRRLLGQE